MDKIRVVIYTDGACSGNPGPGGYAAIIMYGENKKEICGAEKDTTNNRMELKAAIEGLKHLNKPCTVELYSDSAYLVNAYEKHWVDSWKKNGWKNASKEPVKNIELWEELERLRKIHDVTFIKVKGHADNEYNNRCDELAVNAIKDMLNSSNNNEEESENHIAKVFKDFKGIETDRLKFRFFKNGDEPDLFEYCSDEDTTKYITFDTYTDMQTAKDRIKYCLQVYEKFDSMPSIAVEYKENGKVIGSCDFCKWNEKNSVAEIGYVFNKKYWNKGIATEAVGALIKFGFENMGLNRIEIKCFEENIASARVMEKNGLKYEGTLRQIEYIKGRYINVKVYSMLKEEYMN